MGFKPIGGVNRVYLEVAPLSGAATSSPPEVVELMLLEDLSTYTELSTWLGSRPLTKHQLSVVTTLECDIASDTRLSEGLFSGFKATIELNSSQSLELGDVTLHLKTSEVNHGLSPSDTPSIKWLFEGESSRCY